MAIQALYAGLLVFFQLSYVQAGCPDGWIQDGYSCYLFSNVQESWVLASAHCAALGAKLTTIESSMEDSFLRQMINNIYHGDARHAVYWTGGTDFAIEARWVWGLEEIPIAGYTNWNPGQPDDDDIQDCMCLSGLHKLNWDDRSCESKYRFICERSQIGIGSGIIG